MLHFGNEGRNANTGANPDLTRLLIGKIKAAIRPFHLHRHTFVQVILQLPGPVAQRLNHKTELLLLRIPGRSDGIGVRAFRAAGGNKGKLPGLMPRPARL